MSGKEAFDIGLANRLTATGTSKDNEHLASVSSSLNVWLVYQTQIQNILMKTATITVKHYISTQ